MGEIYVTTTADSGAGSLRQAIVDAQDGDVILFDPTVFPVGTTTAILLSTFIYVAKEIEIDGDGRVALNGQNSVRCVQMTGAAHLKNFVVCNGASTNGAGVNMGGGMTTMTNCVIENCNATSSCGGVYLTSSAVGTLNNCKIRNCTSGAHGGGVYFNNSSQGNLNDCVITNCTAGTNGGGIIVASDSTCILNRCSITDCAATSDNGGGVYAYTTGAFTLNGCTIQDNTSADTRRRGVIVLSSVSFSCADTNADALFLSLSDAATKVFSGSVSTVENLYLAANPGSVPTVTFDDGAALAVTTAATVPSGVTFTSAGRGYLAVVSGVDTSNATFNNVVLCSYGAGVSAFWEDLGVLRWDAADVTVPVLLEVGSESNGATQWETLIQTTGNAYTRYFPPHVDLRLFDGEKFLTTSTPDSRTYYYIGGAEGSFVAAADWSLTRGGYAIPEAPTVKDCVFIVGDVAPAEGGF